MKKQLLTVIVLTLSGGFAGSTPVYNHEGPPGSISGPRESTYDSIKSSDRRLSNEARRSLQNDKELSTQAKNINIKVKNGQAFLSGQVLNENEINVIREKVLAINGIHSVNNKLKVQE